MDQFFSLAVPPIPTTSQVQTIYFTRNRGIFYTKELSLKKKMIQAKHFAIWGHKKYWSNLHIYRGTDKTTAQFIHLKTFIMLLTTVGRCVHSMRKDFLKILHFHYIFSLPFKSILTNCLHKNLKLLLAGKGKFWRLPTCQLDLASRDKKKEWGLSLWKWRAAKMKEQMDCAIKMQKEELHF